jgi:hypothetical protein
MAHNGPGETERRCMGGWGKRMGSLTCDAQRAGEGSCIAVWSGLGSGGEVWSAAAVDGTAYPVVKT